MGDLGSCAGEGYSNANYPENQRRRVNLDALAVYERALQYALDDDGRLYRWEEQERVVEPCA